MSSRTGPLSAVSQTSALPRPLDLSYASNRAAIYGTLVFAGVSLLMGRNWRQALGVGGVAMLGWATGRELDPDVPLSAAVALGLAGVASLGQTGRGEGQTAPAVLPGLAALSAARLLTATVGHPVSAPDALALSVQAGAAALGGHRVAALLPAAALAASQAAHDALSPEAAWSAPTAMVAGLLPAWKPRQAEFRLQSRSYFRPRLIFADLLSLAALSFTRQIVAPEQPSSPCDQAPITVSARRLQASRALSLSTLALGLARRESASLLPLAAATLATGLRRASVFPAGGRRPGEQT
ncbi:hypothetical protein [Deinococcus sp.]|uniref:hypothetical protein n=1 Tax=Deinococcus sp. TaxID=47478 RepID=UPI003C7D5D46